MFQHLPNTDEDRHLTPVLKTLAKEFRNGQIVARHSHGRAQLLYAISGVMRVRVDGGAWAVPPLRALWLPQGMPHEIFMVGDVSMRTIYIDAETASELWPECRVVKITPLLRELILNVLTEPLEYQAGSKADLSSQLILLMLKQTPLNDTKLPVPTDRRIRIVADELLQDPGNENTLEIWGEQVGASARTLARLFLAETGLTFGQWRQQLRLAEAICRLALGQPVVKVAHDLGYESQSAFTAMFRRALGETPGRYSAQENARTQFNKSSQSEHEGLTRKK